MKTITAHVLPGQCEGDPAVIVTLSFEAIRHTDGASLSMPGGTVTYHLTDGQHHINGNDLRAPLGWRATAEDNLRALCDFLAADHEHIIRRLDGSCAEHGLDCPAQNESYAEALSAMVGAIEMAATVEHVCFDPAQVVQEYRAKRAQEMAFLTY